MSWSDPIPLGGSRTPATAPVRPSTTCSSPRSPARCAPTCVRRRSTVHDIRAIVPFNLRPLDQPLPAELGNKFGLVYLTLPLTKARREDRLREMSRRMDAIKHSAEGFVAFGILELVGLAPALVEDIAIDVFASKGTGVMTNVPGPRRSVTWRVRRCAARSAGCPTSGELGLGVAIFSYAGTVDDRPVRRPGPGPRCPRPARRHHAELEASSPRRPVEAALRGPPRGPAR